MNLKQDAIYHNILMELEPLFQLPPNEQREVINLIVNRVNVRLQLKEEKVPFLERVDLSPK